MIRWIQKALGTNHRHSRSHRGALHHQLGIPEGQVIPTKVLKWAAVQPGKLGRRARLAITLRKFNKKARKNKRRSR